MQTTHDVAVQEAGAALSTKQSGRLRRAIQDATTLLEKTIQARRHMGIDGKNDTGMSDSVPDAQRFAWMVNKAGGVLASAGNALSAEIADARGAQDDIVTLQNQVAAYATAVLSTGSQLSLWVQSAHGAITSSGAQRPVWNARGEANQIDAVIGGLYALAEALE